MLLVRVYFSPFCYFVQSMGIKPALISYRKQSLSTSMYEDHTYTQEWQ